MSEKFQTWSFSGKHVGFGWFVDIDRAVYVFLRIGPGDWQRSKVWARWIGRRHERHR